MSCSNGDTEWYDKVDQFRVENSVAVKTEERTDWHTVHIFVSSTFKDMHSERDYLSDRVIPVLSDWCREHKINLRVCDLRSIFREKDPSVSIETCMKEIDCCYEENTYPYFLSIMSERYGWKPEKQEITERLRKTYKWLDGISMTCWETLVGAYWCQNPNAMYLFRNPDFLESIFNEDLRALYNPEDELSKRYLSKFKGKIREHYPGQVYEYSVKPNGLAYDHKGREYVNFDGLEQFGEHILDHLKQRILYQYPLTKL